MSETKGDRYRSPEPLTQPSGSGSGGGGDPPRRPTAEAFFDDDDAFRRQKLKDLLGRRPSWIQRLSYALQKLRTRFGR